MPRRRPSDCPSYWIGRLVSVDIDRPMGSRHPCFPDCVYPLNYGYVPGTRAADGQEIDAYVLGLPGPVARAQGRCIAIIHRLDDVEDKLIVVPDGRMLNDEEIRQNVDFQERYFRIAILR